MRQRILFRTYNFTIKSITRSVITFKKLKKMTNDFFNYYMFVHTFQWTSSERLTSVTITVKVAMVTYIFFFASSPSKHREMYFIFDYK